MKDSRESIRVYQCRFFTSHSRCAKEGNYRHMPYCLFHHNHLIIRCPDAEPNSTVKPQEKPEKPTPLSKKLRAFILRKQEYAPTPWWQPEGREEEWLEATT